MFLHLVFFVLKSEVIDWRGDCFDNAAVTAITVAAGAAKLPEWEAKIEMDLNESRLHFQW